MAVSEEVKNWLARARDDLKWTEGGMEVGIWYGACFTAQQAAEKALKGFLLNNGWELKKVHDLRALLEEAVVFEKGLGDYLEDVANLMQFYYKSRHPAYEEFAQLTEEQARGAYASAKKIVEKIEELLG